MERPIDFGRCGKYSGHVFPFFDFFFIKFWNEIKDEIVSRWFKIYEKIMESILILDSYL